MEKLYKATGGPDGIAVKAVRGAGEYYTDQGDKTFYMVEATLDETRAWAERQLDATFEERRRAHDDIGDYFVRPRDQEAAWDHLYVRNDIETDKAYAASPSLAPSIVQFATVETRRFAAAGTSATFAEAELRAGRRYATS